MALNRYIFLHAHWMDAIEWLIYYPSGSGGSRKSFKGWRFVGGGGGDHGQKSVFEVHSR
jgi:hypothetical protein